MIHRHNLKLEHMSIGRILNGVALWKRIFRNMLETLK